MDAAAGSDMDNGGGGGGSAAVPVLPIAAYREDIVEAVRRHRVTIITGETGSGKTTQIGQYLRAAKLGPIAVTQPRRVAAVTVAQRVVEELRMGGEDHVRLGKEVGYTVRFDDCSSDSTEIRYMTDGSLVREALRDRGLSRYKVVVIDEAHERSVYTDILLGLMKRLVRADHYSKGTIMGGSGSQDGDGDGGAVGTQQPIGHAGQGLRLVVMSATLNVDKFQTYLGTKWPLIQVPGRMYPCEVHYAATNTPLRSYVENAVTHLVHLHRDEGPGHVLLFLTGEEEIERACKLAERRLQELQDTEEDVVVHPWQIFPLYGALPAEMQRAAFVSVDQYEARKIVIATNIAETSLTIDGIRFVIDTGLVKQKRFNPQSGMDELEVVPISQGSAKQRAGRAGRTGPGKVLRLYTDERYRELRAETVPEVQRSNLANVVLLLKVLGVDQVLAFDFLDKPGEPLLLQALKELFLVDAIDSTGCVTPDGKIISEFPLEPPLGRCMVEAARLGVAPEMATVVAFLGNEQLFQPRAAPGMDAQARAMHMHSIMQRFQHPEGDHGTMINVYAAFQHDQEASTSTSTSTNKKGSTMGLHGWCRAHGVNPRTLARARRVREQLIQIAAKAANQQQNKNHSSHSSNHGNHSSNHSKEKSHADAVDLVGRACASGLYLRSARHTRGGAYRTLGRFPTHARPHPTSVFAGNEHPPEWVVYHELVSTTGTWLRNMVRVEQRWMRPLLPRLLADIDYAQLAGADHVVGVGAGAGAGAEEHKEQKEKEKEKGQEQEGEDGNANEMKTNTNKEEREEELVAQKRKLESTVDAARERFLKRKQEQQKQQKQRRRR